MAKTHKKTKRKVSRLITQSGGTLFNIRPGDLDQLQHIGIFDTTIYERTTRY